MNLNIQFMVKWEFICPFDGDHRSIMTVCFLFHRPMSPFTKFYCFQFGSVQCSPVAQSCPTLCNPMNRSMPGLPVHHHLPEFIQTHVHRVCDVTQPSHSWSSPSPPAPNPSQHQSLFQWVNSFSWSGQSTGVSALASFLPKKFQGWSPSEWAGWISLHIVKGERNKELNFQVQSNSKYFKIAFL